MNLASLAEQDLQHTLEDSDNGFGWPITLNDGTTDYQIVGQTTDTHFFVDPQTGEGVESRRIEFTVRISTLTALGGGIPIKSWSASFTDTNGNSWTLGIIQNRIDRKLGIYNIFAEIEDVSE
jgi:hypothetical protein